MSRETVRQQASGDLRDYLDCVAGDPCAFCAQRATALDHIVARANGGSDAWTNLTAACARCNARKRTTTLLGFLGWLTYEAECEYAKRLLDGSHAWREVGL